MSAAPLGKMPGATKLVTNPADDKGYGPDRLAPFRLTPRGALVWTLFLCIFAMGVGPIVDIDYWSHMKSGQQILTTLAIPHVETWSSTRYGHEWVTDEWLIEAMMYGLFQLWGSAGQILVFALIAVLTWAPVYATCRDYGASQITAVLATALGASASAFVWNVRPIMVVLLLFSWWLRAIFLYRVRVLQIQWIFPVLAVIWVNSHGSYLVGLGVLGLVATMEALKFRFHPFAQAQLTVSRLKQLWQIVPVCAVVTILNPHLWRAWTYPFETLRSTAQRANIQDWFSPNFHLVDVKFFEGMLFAAIACFVYTRRRVDWSDAVLFFVFLYMSLESWRHIPFFCIAVVPMLVRYLPLRRLKPIPPTAIPWSRAALNWGVVALVAAFLAWARVVPPIADALRDPLAAPHEPSGAVAFLRAHHIPGVMFNNQPWGGYLDWYLVPEYRVFIDGRSGTFGDEIINEYQKLMQLKPDWAEPLQRYDVNFALLPRDAPAEMFLRAQGWKRIYADSLASILLRDTPQNAGLIAQFAG